MKTQFQIGDEVRVIRPIRNDGTFPGMNKGQLLIRRGSVGVVEDIGTFLQDQIIYAVKFYEDGRLVGCREQEVIALADIWVPHEFDTRDRVVTVKTLGVGGQIRASAGEVGEIMRVLNESEPVQYHVIFGEHILQVPEAFLHLAGDDDEHPLP